MSQEQPQRPLTYGDMFDDVKGELASEPITKEDASLMQSCEAIASGQNLKGGAASTMQSAAMHNINAGLIDAKTHSNAAEQGIRVSKVMVDGQVRDTQYVGDQPVATSTTYVPTLSQAAATKGVTIGEALQEAAILSGEKLVDFSDARAIESAEARATGIPLPMKGGVAAATQSAAQRNAQGEKITLGEVLTDASDKLIFDKVITQEDVDKVMGAETREGGAGTETLTITPALQAAVDLNSEVNRYIETQEGGGVPSGAEKGVLELMEGGGSLGEIIKEQLLEQHLLGEEQPSDEQHPHKE